MAYIILTFIFRGQIHRELEAPQSFSIIRFLVNGS